MTSQQAVLYRYLLGRIDNPVCPTIDELVTEMGLRSRSGVHRLVTALREQGLVEPAADRARARMIRAVRPGRFIGVSSEALRAELQRRGEL